MPVLKILYFASIDWEFITQRPQHLARRLSREFRDFYYIQPLGLRNLRPSDIRRVATRLLGFFKTKNPYSGMRIKNLVFIPLINPIAQKINIYLLRKQIRAMTDKETIIWITTPISIMPGLLNGVTYKALVYEMMDDYARMHPLMESYITETEKWLIDRADLVITTSSALSEKTKKYNLGKEAMIIGNGVDYAFFTDASYERPPELSGMNKIVGYVGAVESWIDFDTIEFLAESRRDVDFVFIGPIRARGLPERENIHFLGKRDYSTMPLYCNSFDVCLIPFRPGKFADTINPVKLYEYFALGKPVVAYEMKELLPFRELLYLVRDRKEFLEKLEEALDEEDDVIRVNRRGLAKANDWSAKAELLRAALSRL